jgi:hypothetical protein
MMNVGVEKRKYKRTPAIPKYCFFEKQRIFKGMTAENEISWQAQLPLEEFDAIRPFASTSPSRASTCRDGH